MCKWEIETYLASECWCQGEGGGGGGVGWVIALGGKGSGFLVLNP